MTVLVFATLFCGATGASAKSNRRTASKAPSTLNSETLPEIFYSNGKMAAATLQRLRQDLKQRWANSQQNCLWTPQAGTQLFQLIRAFWMPGLFEVVDVGSIDAPVPEIFRRIWRLNKLFTASSFQNRSGGDGAIDCQTEQGVAVATELRAYMAGEILSIIETWDRHEYVFLGSKLGEKVYSCAHSRSDCLRTPRFNSDFNFRLSSEEAYMGAILQELSEISNLIETSTPTFYRRDSPSEDNPNEFAQLLLIAARIRQVSEDLGSSNRFGLPTCSSALLLTLATDLERFLRQGERSVFDRTADALYASRYAVEDLTLRIAQRIPCTSSSPMDTTMKSE